MASTCDTVLLLCFFWLLQALLHAPEYGLESPVQQCMS